MKKKQISISRTRLRQLVNSKTKTRLNELIFKNIDRLTPAEMLSQLQKNNGDFSNQVNTSTNRFTNKTENTEIMLSLDLSELYFPGIETVILFEPRIDFDWNKQLTYDDLIAGIKNDTHIDCSITDGKKVFNFQIKRYNQKYHKFETDHIFKFIKDIAETGYGDMSGTILSILLQPEEKGDFGIYFPELHEKLETIKDKITFQEINAVYNENNQHITWVQIFPESGHYKIPINFESQEMHEKQKKMRTEK